MQEPMTFEQFVKAFFEYAGQRLDAERVKNGSLANDITAIHRNADLRRQLISCDLPHAPEHQFLPTSMRS